MTTAYDANGSFVGRIDALRVFACLTAALVLTQFLTVGLALFGGYAALLDYHRSIGFAIGLPIAVMVGIVATRRTQGLAFRLAALTAAWVVQFALVMVTRHTGMLLPQGLHPFNGALLLVSSLSLTRRHR